MTLAPDTPLHDAGERDLLRRLRARVPTGAGVIVGIGDDAAAVEIGPLGLVTTDALVEGVHFRRDSAPARLLGRKALSINLSDIGAMGGLSRYATISLCLPPSLDVGWIDELYDGLLERAAETGVAIVGGNVTRSTGAIVVDVTLLGDSPRPLLRTGARPGDRVVVTGTLGAAAEGLRLLGEGARLDSEGELTASGIWTASSTPDLLSCLRAQLDPRPPLALARAIAERELARAAMDLSDGLSSDLLEICRESGVGAVLDGGAIPLDPATARLERARGGSAFRQAVHGGEDYQLLLSVDEAALEELGDLARVFDTEISVIGEFVAGEPQVRVREGLAERALEPGGHDHFASAGA